MIHEVLEAPGYKPLTDTSTVLHRVESCVNLPIMSVPSVFSVKPIEPVFMSSDPTPQYEELRHSTAYTLVCKLLGVDQVHVTPELDKRIIQCIINTRKSGL